MSNLPFEFATAHRIVFGAGVVSQLPRLAQQTGASSVLMVAGANPQRVHAQLDALVQAGLHCEVFSVRGEPSVDDVRLGAAAGQGCQAVVALGGGSVLDAGKAIAAMLANGGDPLDYLEVVGRGAPLAKPSLPLIAVPTTAGTGSEVTRNAVLGVPEAGVKASMRSAGMLPWVALVDPDLLASLPPEVLRSSGLDAFAQNIEPFLSLAANPLTDALARDGIRRSARTLRGAYLHGPDAAAREDLALASLFGGISLANAGLGVVHGFAAPLGGMFNAPHGAVCAALLAASLEINHLALRQRAPDHPSVARLAELGALLQTEPTAEAAVAWVARLCADLEVPGLAAYGLTVSDLPSVVAKAQNASSMKKNPLVLTEAELTEILHRSL